MGSAAVSVRNLGKRYSLGTSGASYATLRDTLASMASSPLRRAASTKSPRPARATPRTIWALRDVSFDVSHGEAMAIIGRNGAGKSTLLKILSRITAPTTGRAEVCGRVGALLEVGTGFHQELTGRENVFLNGAILGMSRADIASRFDEIVDFSGVEGHLDTQVKYYSSGMKMRLAFAVAAHLEPEILVIDEVLAVGDADFQRKCVGKMKQAAGDGRTVLFVSHNLAAAAELCRTGLLLQGGTVGAAGPARTVIAEYIADATTDGGRVNITRPSNLSARSGVRLVAVMVRNPAGEPAGTLSRSGGVEAVIDVRVSRPVRNCQLRLQLWSDAGFCLIESSSADSSPRSSSTLEAGSYRFVCHVPESFLRGGFYRLGVYATSATTGMLDHAWDVVGFEVLDWDSAPAVAGETRGSAMYPLLSWDEFQLPGTRARTVGEGMRQTDGDARWQPEAPEHVGP